jgi:hypothetical protein
LLQLKLDGSAELGSPGAPVQIWIKSAGAPVVAAQCGPFRIMDTAAKLAESPRLHRFDLQRRI